MFKNYYSPTPVIIRKIADALLAVCTTFSTYSIVTNDKKLGIILLIFGVLGKLLSNVFSYPSLDNHKIDEDQGCNCAECNCKAAEDQTPIKDNTDEH